MVETRSALVDDDSRAFLDTAAGLATRGHPVELFLLQDAVLAARPGVEVPALRAAVRAGVRVRVDAESLARRGGGVPDGADPASTDDLAVSLLAPDCTVVWH